MTAKNRNKNNASDKNSIFNQDDVAKKSSKVTERAGPFGDNKAKPVSETCTKFFGALCYMGLIAAAGFASFYLQRVREDISQINAMNEQSIQRYAELAIKMEAVIQQVDAVKGDVTGFDSTISMLRAELNGVERAQQRGDAETQRVEEALHRLQKEILKDLSHGIQEAKLTRQRDFSSLEQAVEERLAELSTSIGDSVAGVAEVQGQTHSQLRELRARLDGLSDSGNLQQELQNLAETVSSLQASGTAVEKTVDSVAGQIVAVGKELQTRNEEVASQSQEIRSVRDLVLSTAGSLKQSMSAAEASLQALLYQSDSLQTRLDRAEGSLQSLEKELREAIDQAERSTEDMQVRIKSLEDSIDAITASAAEQGAKVESTMSKYDSHENTLAVLARETENVRSAAEKEAQLVKSSLDAMNQAQQALHSQIESDMNNILELKAIVADLGGVKTELASGHSSQTQQLEALEQRLNTLGEVISEYSASDDVKASVSQVQNDLHQLQTAVDSLVLQSVKLERHQEAIALLQENLEKIHTAVVALSKGPEVLEGKE